MTFNQINRQTWKRDQYFENYMASQTSFSMTVDIDITNLYEFLKEHHYKLYPALIFMTTKVVNNHIEFRTTFNSENKLGYWSKMEASYTIFDSTSKEFYVRWLEECDSFKEFHKRYLEKQKIPYEKNSFSEEDIPENCIAISMIPWQSFTGFNLNINNNPNYLLPITTFGKYYIRENKRWLPVSIQVHHAVCDGYHASLFIEELQQLANNPQHLK
ncbi:CatA-like O-acetyltransferase [Vagococcus carniphilus]|uniref:CatA-like O-acetyltransferase n=1 Tax=Vagococcus carniphilus TaxID=218144 RepID=UPI002890DE3B|nr:CatA-like O-acetyltransferase [Vagococcus carniphilus]MDT2864946.1 CatA-like O-acetyltransferase [Vagococcus carniphilus]